MHNEDDKVSENEEEVYDEPSNNLKVYFGVEVYVFSFKNSRIREF